MKIPNEVKIGLIAILTIALFVWGYNFMKGKNILKPARTYMVIYDHIDGLEESNAVLINGYKVGLVNDIRFAQDNSGNLAVTILIEEQFDVPKNTIARIYPADLMGSRAISLVLGDSEQMCGEGDTLIADVEGTLQEQVKRELLPLKDRAGSLITSMDSVLGIIQTTFDENFTKDLQKSFRHLSKTTNTLDTLLTNPDGRVARFLDHIESISSNLQDNNEELSAIFSNLSAITDSLASANVRSTVNNLDRTLAGMDSLLAGIHRGEGTMGMLVTNDTLYQYLEHTAHSLEALLRDLKENPKRYVHFSLFGGGKKSK